MKSGLKQDELHYHSVTCKLLLKGLKIGGRQLSPYQIHYKDIKRFKDFHRNHSKVGTQIINLKMQSSIIMALFLALVTGALAGSESLLNQSGI